MASTELWLVLRDLIILLGAALILGLLFERLRQSAIVGCMIAGTLVGPGMLGFVHDRTSIQALAEIGVALLLFTIGLETSWRHFRSLGLAAIVGGALQVVVTMAVTACVLLLLGQPISAAVVYGGIVAMSSTATVVRSLQERSELDTDHGRAALGILLLQDAAVVPLVLVTEFLSEGAPLKEAVVEFGVAGLRAAILVFTLIAVGGFIMPRLLTAAALAKNRDLPVILALSACMAASWAAHGLGLSPALGAFAAGAILADSPLATQMRADVAPFRIVFVSLFFAAMGMLADLQWILLPGNAARVAMLLTAIVAGKTAVIWLIVSLLRRSSMIGLATGLCLAQIGEFSFVLAAIGRENGVLDEDGFQLVITSSLISLILTPTLVSQARRLAERVTHTHHDLHPDEHGDHSASRRVLIVGYGPAGKEIVEAVTESGYEPLIIDMNPKLAAAARAHGLKVLIGDAGRPEVLHQARVASAAGVAVTVPDHRTAVTIIHHCRQMAGEVPIVVRCRYNVHAADLQAAGATVLVDEEDTVGRLLGWRMVRAMTDRAEQRPGGTVVIQEEAMP